MQYLKTYRLVLAIGALLFIARPFVGFSMFEELRNGGQENTLLVKAFAKRKPEFLEEAETRSVLLLAMLQQKAGKFNLLFTALFACMAGLFSAILSRLSVSNTYTKQPYVQVTPVYLLLRKLTI